MLKSPAIGRTYMVPELETKEEENKLFLRLYSLSRDESRFVWGIAKDGLLIGMIHEVAREDGAIELGWFIDPARQRQGYASEAAEAVIEYLFAAGTESITAGAFEENPASMRVMEKCGMRPTGKSETIAYRGADHRCVFYEIENRKEI